MADNGALTLTTALALVQPNCYIYMPANAIVAGSIAGWYFCQMSTTALGTVFADRYITGAPALPSAPTPLVSVGPGAYVQTTAVDLQAQNVIVPGGVMGSNGLLRCVGWRSHINNANAKLNRLRFGGLTTQAANITASATQWFTEIIENQGVTNRQRVAQDNAGDQSLNGTVNPIDRAINTLQDNTLEVTLLLNVATDWMIMERFFVELIPAA